MHVGEINSLLEKSNQIIYSQAEIRRHYDDLTSRITDLQVEVQALSEDLERFTRASAIVGNVSDENVKNSLNAITAVINRALALIFPYDPRKIKIEQSIYRGRYPHFNVTLYTGYEEKKRSFKQSGTGLGQIISLLFDVALNDARGGRKLLIIDEVLNGLHPDAKILVRDIILALSKSYQFVIVEYGFDVGKQYEVVKKGTEATITEYEERNYYENLVTKRLDTDLVFSQ